MAKVINRSGRGYSFEVLRARVLFGGYKKPRKQAEKDVTEGLPPPPPPVPRKESLRAKMLREAAHTCASCGGVYEGTELHLTRMGPLFEDEPDINLVVMCANCKVRFHHTERANAHNNLASTP